MNTIVTKTTINQLTCKCTPNTSKIGYKATWIFDNMVKATETEIRETLKKAGAKVISTQHLEKGGTAINMESKNSVAKMINLKYWLAENKNIIHIPKNMLQGCAKLFIRNYNATTSAEGIVTTTEEA